MSSESSKATRTTLLKRGLFLIGAAVGLQGGRPSTSASRRSCLGLASRYSAIASALSFGSSGEGGSGRIARCSST